MMCQTVQYQGRKIDYNRFIKEHKEDVTTGICDSVDCRSAYILFASCGNETLADILKKELKIS